MRRPTRAVIAAAVGGVLVGAVTLSGASALTPNDKACRAGITIPYDNGETVAYEACRFDKLEAALNGATPSPSPTATPTPSDAPTVAKPTTTPTASPAPTVTPTTTTPSPTDEPTSASPSPTPTVAPPASGKPGPSNTGVPDGVTLTPYTGPKTITTAGTVIDGKDVSGALTISAKNVVIKNSKVHGTDSIGINNGGSGSVTIQDSEVYGFETGIVYGNVTVLRVDLHDTTYDGIKLSSNASVRDSWIHNPRPTGDAHYDGIQVQNGVVNTVISGNNIDVSGADANTTLFLCPDLGPSTAGPLAVDGNWLNGGNFSVAVLDGNNGQYFIKDIRVTNNRFGSSHSFGYANVNVPITQSGNVADSTGAPIKL